MFRFDNYSPVVIILIVVIVLLLIAQAVYLLSDQKLTFTQSLIGTIGTIALV